MLAFIIITSSIVVTLLALIPTMLDSESEF
jgi:hypothetical protein